MHRNYPKSAFKPQKKRFNVGNLANEINFVSFPIPLAQSNATSSSGLNNDQSNLIYRIPRVIYPFRDQPGRPFITGIINWKSANVEIFCPCASLLLHLYGYYGKDSYMKDVLKKPSAIPMKLGRSNLFFGDSNWCSLNEKAYLDQMQRESLLRNFKTPLITNEIVRDLYSNSTQAKDKSLKNLNLSNIDIEKSTSSFTKMFVKLRQEFVNDQSTREEYVLQLKLEEALFLCHAVGVLNIALDKKGCSNKFGSITYLWHKINDLYQQKYKKNFIIKYAAYYFFRSRGFIVKCGLKFGCTFVLYTKSPDQFHAMYSVTLVQRQHDVYVPKLTTHSLAAFVRCTSAIQKVPIICVVNVPNNWDLSVTQPLTAIKELSIQLTIASRWQPEEER